MLSIKNNKIYSYSVQFEIYPNTSIAEIRSKAFQFSLVKFIIIQIIETADAGNYNIFSQNKLRVESKI